MFRIALGLSTAILCLAPPVRGQQPPTQAPPTQLLASQVAIIAARGNAESQELAEYYANARAIPVTNICQVDVPGGDDCPRGAWISSVRPAIRHWLAENDPDHEIRCLTTVWGIPLKIGPAAPGAAAREYQEYLAGERSQRLAALRDAVKEFDGLAPAGEISTHSVGASAGVGAAAGAPRNKPAGGNADPANADAAAAGAPPASEADELKQLKTQLDVALKGAQGRINELPQGPLRSAGQNHLQQLVASIGGAGVILQNLQGQINGLGEPRPEVVAEFHRLRGAAAAWVEARQLLEQRPPGIERDASILSLIERLGGQLETIVWLDGQIADVAKNETFASFDSELALVLWQDGYELLRWQPNYLQMRYSRSQLARTFPTLMTARIDAPTLALAHGLIDASIAAERDGLSGKAYFDSRGLATTGESADFDRALVATAEAIRTQTTVEVGLNADPQLFASGECPDAALYCGWYSLGKYVDAFEFNPGAVAYHVAGDEAAGLHDPKSQRWCKRLLEDGAAATVGGVYEPYLAAFPRPNDFFALLLNGERTLAECYWLTQPRTSWSMVLIGDPLYRPFKNRRVNRPESAIR